jgi:transposase
VSLSESIEKVKHLFIDLVCKTTGGDKRRAAAKIAKEYGFGGQTFAAKQLKMSRNTVRKGIQEIESGEIIEDKYSLRGRDKATKKLPKLENHIKELLDSQCQVDPKFQTDRLYTNLSIHEIRKQLIKRNGYTDEELPTERTLNTIVNDLRYTVKTVKKTIPIKKVPLTELIFDNLERIHQFASKNDKIIRLSIDTKDRIKVGCYSRGGKNRVEVHAYDHDFGDKYITPFGIMNVKEKTSKIYLSETKVTADFMVDMLEDYWITNGYSGSGKTLLLNVDNGSENSSRRTQFVKRMIQFSIDHNTEVILAYYPPYHSKYNPIERIWGVLEQHWGGALLDSEETIKSYIETTTYDKKHLTAEIIDTVYKTGVRVCNKAMQVYEKALARMAGLEKWYVRISPERCMDALAFTDYFY